MRTTLLQIVSTSDRAWLTFLAGVLLLAREFVAPGWVVPGVAGGLAIVLSAWSLWPPTPLGAALFALAILLLAVQAWWPGRLPGVLLSGVTGTAAAHFLLQSPRQISFPAALATAPAAGLLAWLLWMARRAYDNKVRNESNSSR